jgi:hypothetical protein
MFSYLERRISISFEGRTSLEEHPRGFLELDTLGIVV